MKVGRAWFSRAFIQVFLVRVSTQTKHYSLKIQYLNFIACLFNLIMDMPLSKNLTIWLLLEDSISTHKSVNLIRCEGPSKARSFSVWMKINFVILMFPLLSFFPPSSLYIFFLSLFKQEEALYFYSCHISQPSIFLNCL